MMGGGAGGGVELSILLAKAHSTCVHLLQYVLRAGRGGALACNKQLLFGKVDLIRDTVHSSLFQSFQGEKSRFSSLENLCRMQFQHSQPFSRQHKHLNPPFSHFLDKKNKQLLDQFLGLIIKEKTDQLQYGSVRSFVRSSNHFGKNPIKSRPSASAVICAGRDFALNHQLLTSLEQPFPPM